MLTAAYTWYMVRMFFNFVVILLSEVEWGKFKTTGCFDLLVIHFPDYSNQMSMCVHGFVVVNR